MASPTPEASEGGPLCVALLWLWVYERKAEPTEVTRLLTGQEGQAWAQARAREGGSQVEAASA